MRVTTAATFVVPALMAAYWRRATAAGVFAAMLFGAEHRALAVRHQSRFKSCGITPLGPGPRSTL